jgi:hypothetical protein
MIIAFTFVVLFCGFVAHELISRKKYVFAIVLFLFVGLLASFVQVGYDYLYSHRYGYNGYYGRF